MTVIIDYGVGNLFSLISSFSAVSEEAYISRDPDKIKNADRLILPGVGAFGDAAKKLKETGMEDAVRDEVKKGKPLLGICLGMQLLFDSSSEYGFYKGLGFIKGSVEPIAGVISPELDIPHMGWNSLHTVGDNNRLITKEYDGKFVYFVHSFAAFGCEDSLSAYTDYSAPLTASVEKDNVFGTQFHPEKSGETGLKILSEFCKL